MVREKFPSQSYGMARHTAAILDSEIKDTCTHRLGEDLVVAKPHAAFDVTRSGGNWFLWEDVIGLFD